MKKKVIASILAASMAAMALAGCGNGKTTGEAQQDTAASEASASTAAGSTAAGCTEYAAGIRGRNMEM